MTIRMDPAKMLVITLLCVLSLACREETRRNTPSFGIEAIEPALETSFQGTQAYEHARYFTQFWRIAGSPSFDSCVKYISENLESSGFSGVGPIPPNNGVWTVNVLEDPAEQKVWIPLSARLVLRSPEERVVLDFAATPLMLCSNSHSTSVSSSLVSIRGGRKASDFEGRDVRGTIVLCDDPAAQVWPLAVGRGALGIISSFVAPYNSPQRFPDIISEGTIPRSDSIASFGLKVSPKIGRELQSMIERGSVEVRVEIESIFRSAPIKTVVAEIPGRIRPVERVLFLAHLDHYKPGANDNASGAATLLELSTSLSRLIRSGAIPPPSRTLTFLWVDEYNGTGFWMKRHKSELSAIQAVFVLDMVGGDPARTGGLFRIEKMPDPAVLWFRPPDQHSGWGVGRWQEEKLFGNYLNDFMLSVVRARSAKTGWKFTSNVWEGGSDHDPFIQAGIPAILSWHFPDPFYHSSLDGMENISAEQMKQAGISIASAGLVLAFGSVSSAEQILDIVVKAAAERLDLVQANAVVELADVQDHPLQTIAATRRQEKKVLEAWTRWYKEAYASVLRIPVDGPPERLRDRIEKESKQLQDWTETTILVLGID